MAFAVCNLTTINMVGDFAAPCEKSTSVAKTHTHTFSMSIYPHWFAKIPLTAPHRTAYIQAFLCTTALSLMRARSLNRASTQHISAFGARGANARCALRTNLSQNCHNKLQIVPAHKRMRAWRTNYRAVGRMLACISGGGGGGSFAKRSVARNRAISFCTRLLVVQWVAQVTRCRVWQLNR